jgi:FkbM family methyltransferase
MQAALSLLARYQRKLQEKGLREIISGRWRWAKQSFQMDNWCIGRLVELCGNRVPFNGITLDLDNPLIPTPSKSTLLFGIYETAELDLTRRFIDRSIPTVELGGSIGGIACVTNRLLANPDKHVVVECNPTLVETLAKNRRINQCQFTLVEAALAYGGDTVSFSTDGFLQGRINRVGGEGFAVSSTTLARLLDAHGFETINLISDCEGAEVDLVANEPELLRQKVKWLIMETHAEHLGEGPIDAMLRRLTELGFETMAVERTNVVALRNRNLMDR